jgi:hypothetical protein
LLDLFQVQIVIVLLNFINTKFTIKSESNNFYRKIMSEEEEEENFVEEEKRRLKELGVTSTWDILTTREKKKKDLENKSFRGFN